jgi:hypothetical protein
MTDLENDLRIYDEAPSYWRKEFRAMQPGRYRAILKLRRENNRRAQLKAFVGNFSVWMDEIEKALKS